MSQKIQPLKNIQNSTKNLHLIILNFHIHWGKAKVGADALM